LAELGEFDAAKNCLAEHIRNWGNPPGYLTLAQVHEKQGDLPSARELLEKMIIKVKGSPPYYYKRNRHYIGQAERMLKGLRR
jgi:hypothetical protein